MDEVRDALGIPTESIYDTDMATLGSFYASSSSISDIQGMEYGTNLTELDLDSKRVGELHCCVAYLGSLPMRSLR